MQRLNPALKDSVVLDAYKTNKRFLTVKLFKPPLMTFRKKNSFVLVKKQNAIKNIVHALQTGHFVGQNVRVRVV